MDSYQNYISCEEMMAILQNCKSETSEILSLLQTMEGYISKLDKDYKPIVKLLMNLNWLDRGLELIEVYKAFMLNLVSANVVYLKPFLTTLIKKFLQDGTISENMDQEAGRSRLEGDFHHVHSLLQSLIKIVPMTLYVIFPLLEENFPYFNKGVPVFENYTRNILTMTTYIPSMRKDILDLIVKQMLKLDVRSSREAISNAVSDSDLMNEDDDEESIFSMDDCDSKEKVKLCKKKVIKANLTTTLPTAASLDTMMSLMFKYIHETCHPSGKLSWDATKKLYRELLSCFDKFILPSHSSNHVQFIIFYICSFKEELAVGFIDYLWKKVIDPNTQAIYRRIGSYYIGSFLTRASYISDKTSKEVLDLMLKWLHKYLDQMSDNTHADMVHNCAFYSVCQSAFYIFCFKHSQLLQRKKDHRWAESLNFQRLVTCKLNPLKVLDTIIVQTFASAARTHQIAFCDTIIERNNRYSIPVSSQQTMPVARERQLLSYFPFDPYLLPGSCSSIIPLYKEFHGSVADDKADDVQDDDEDDFLPDDVQCSTSYEPDPTNICYSKSPMDFMHYGTSPGFQHTS